MLLICCRHLGALIKLLKAALILSCNGGHREIKND